MPAPTQSVKKYYTVEEANAMLPLLRSILRDITQLANDMHDRHERLQRLMPDDEDETDTPHVEELRNIETELDRCKEQFREYIEELKNLQVELKDVFVGLIDFPSRREGREVYLCWKLGEPAVAYWHDLESGFAGRLPISAGPELQI